MSRPANCEMPRAHAQRRDAARGTRRILADRLAEIQTPVQIINGAHDPVALPVNAEYLHQRLPKSKLDLLDSGHFAWEDRADEYAALITRWWADGYATI